MTRLFGEFHDIAALVGRPVNGIGVTDHRIRTGLTGGDDFGHAAVDGYPPDRVVSAVPPIHVRRVDMEEDQIGETADLLTRCNDGRYISNTTGERALLDEIAAIADDADPIKARGIQRNGGRARLSGRKRRRDAAIEGNLVDGRVVAPEVTIDPIDVIGIDGQTERGLTRREDRRGTAADRDFRHAPAGIGPIDVRRIDSDIQGCALGARENRRIASSERCLVHIAAVGCHPIHRR